jgi:hypothetical protein
MASLAQVSDVRATQSDPTLTQIAYLWRDLDDDVLLTALGRASRKVEGLVSQDVGRAVRLVPFDVTETVRLADADDGWAAYVSAKPALRPELWVGDLTGLTTQGISPTDVDLDTVTFDPVTGRIWMSTQPYGCGGLLTATYSGGYDPAPEDLVEATILIAADTWLVSTDARDGQMDAQDIWTRAMTSLKPWGRVGRPRAKSVGLA